MNARIVYKASSCGFTARVLFDPTKEKPYGIELIGQDGQPLADSPFLSYRYQVRNKARRSVRTEMNRRIKDSFLI